MQAQKFLPCPNNPKTFIRPFWLKPKSVIRPFYVIFYNCLQSFAFYKASFACF